MAKQLNAEQKTIGEIFMEPRISFLIPDYQRPYAWEREQCETLWNDIKDFAVPDNNIDNFNESDTYFFGTILIYHNELRSQYEVIDGQQRLMTFLLMLRAFYEAFGNMQDNKARNIFSSLEQCIWNTDRFRNPDKTSFKITSQVITDNDATEFKKILTTGEPTKGNKSNYAQNYCYFQDQIKNFKSDSSDYFLPLLTRILDNCILLPIKVDSQETAFQIFTTLNASGMPLSDADIFKAQFYKYYSADEEKKEKFISDWKNLEETCGKIFHPKKGVSPIEELFTTYMFYIKASEGSRSTSFKGLRKFYEVNNYARLDDETFENLKALANFWKEVYLRNYNRLSERVIRQLYILEYSPYAIWRHAISVYFLVYKDNMRRTDDKDFYKFLNKLTAFIFAHAIYMPGVDSIRLPVHNEIVNLYQNKPVEFKGYEFNAGNFTIKRKEFFFSNQKLITRAILAWWIFHDDKQELPPIDTKLEIEHIYSKNRQEELADKDNLELLGNKTLLESSINIRATDSRFSDKKRYYLGQKIKGKKHDGTFNLELRDLAETHDDFTEQDILRRNEKIFDAFIAYLRDNNLLI